jgi:hypothetical protein
VIPERVGFIVDTSRSGKGVLSTSAELSCVSFLPYYTNLKTFVLGMEEVTILKGIFLLVKYWLKILSVDNS